MIFILGIDSLDYELVEKWKLKNLKQLEYGEINVPISEKLGIPSSPEVWGSFLAGRHVYINFQTISSMNPILTMINKLNINLYKGFGRKIMRFVKTLGIRTPHRFGCLKDETFLDITNSKEINVPFYSFDNATFDIASLFGVNKLSLNRTVEEIIFVYENRKKQILSEIEKINNSEIVFAFIHTIDMLQHLLYNHISEIKKNYIDLDNYVSILKRKLENNYENVIFIFVSDHGFDFQKGTHSMKGFYSSNVNLIPKPENITDFYGIILDLVKKNNEIFSS